MKKIKKLIEILKKEIENISYKGRKEIIITTMYSIKIIILTSIIIKIIEYIIYRTIKKLTGSF